MRGPGRLLFAVLLLTSFALVRGGVVLAQTSMSQPGNSQQQLDIAAARAERKAVVGQNMNLTAAQGKVFWPLYNAYEERMDKIEDRHIRELKNYVASYNSLTDDAANQKLDEVIAIQQARLETQKQYVPRFRSALPGVVVTRFFQIDNKMRAMIQCNIAQMVPLAQQPQAASANQNN